MQICDTVLILMSVVLIGKKETGKQTEIERETERDRDRQSDRERRNKPTNKPRCIFLYWICLYDAILL